MPHSGYNSDCKYVQEPILQTSPLYITQLGASYLGDSRHLLDELESDSVQLIVTSPPFALQREKSYGNVAQAAYVDWLAEFCRKVYRVMTPDGSFVLDLGGADEKGRPIRSLYNYRVLIKLCDELNFKLCRLVGIAVVISVHLYAL